MGKKAKEFEHLQKKYKHKKEKFAQIQRELQNETAPLEEFENLKVLNQQMQGQIEKMQEKTKMKDKEVEKAQKQYSSTMNDLEVLKKEKKDLVLKCINVEQEAQDIKRDLEVKDIKIESLQNIIKKRGLDSSSAASA